MQKKGLLNTNLYKKVEKQQKKTKKNTVKFPKQSFPENLKSINNGVDQISLRSAG